MELNKLIGFRLKDALDALERFNIHKYSFEITKEPRGEKKEISENCRVLRITKKGNTVNILVCHVD